MAKKKTITDIIVEGLKASERVAMERAVATNTPFIVWEDNKVKKIPPKEIKNF